MWAFRVLSNLLCLLDKMQLNQTCAAMPSLAMTFALGELPREQRRTPAASSAK